MREEIRSNARGSAHSKGKGETARERMVRQERHKVHVMALLAMGLIRNRWLNDPELQVRLQLLLRMNRHRLHWQLTTDFCVVRVRPASSRRYRQPS